MDRFCVFCGKRPINKNAEHILPEWLLKLTGDINRTFTLNTFSMQGSSPREFSASKFKFPACTKCNIDYSELEGKAKGVMEDVLSLKPMSEEQWIILLDWFDKVRIGLWLGFIYLDKNPFGVRPNFHIDSRLGMTDRALLIAQRRGPSLRCTFAGSGTPYFHLRPFCFSLTVNHMSFINIAEQNLVSYRLGMPYMNEKQLRLDGRIHGELYSGTGKIRTPVIQLPFNCNETVIMQPIASGVSELLMEPESFESDYFIRNAKDSKRGVGHVWIGNDKPEKYPVQPSSIWVPEVVQERESFVISHTLLVYEMLLKASKKRLDLTLFPKDRQLEYRKTRNLCSRIYENTIPKIQELRKKAELEEGP
ncbi:MAG: hypothetical protein GY835_05790 [bacterium]|nr:hypothetical protein [bacterium]